MIPPMQGFPPDPAGQVTLANRRSPGRDGSSSALLADATLRAVAQIRSALAG